MRMNLLPFFTTSSSSSSDNIQKSMATRKSSSTTTTVMFEDMLPLMANKLGGEGLIKELCNGFRLLMDKDRKVITFDSLKRNSAAVLGLNDLLDDELMGMMREGDIDGDGTLSEMEFCVLMFRLSPELMVQSQNWLHDSSS